MKKSEAIRIIKEVMKECNCTGGGSSFSSGGGEQYATPLAFKKRRNKKRDR